MELLFLLLLVLFVIISSGIISASEVAILSITYPKVKELLTGAKTQSQRRGAELLGVIKENLEKYISTIVVLNNIVIIIGSIYVGAYAAQIFGEVYLGIVSGTLTFMIIIFSEIIPKILGERYAVSYSLMIARPLVVLTTALSPLLFIVNVIVRVFLRNGNKGNQVSEGEIKEMAVLGKQEGSINEYESELIGNVFDMDDTEAFEVMVPKGKVFTLDCNANYEKVVKIIRRSGHTRFPIMKKNEVIGLVNVKDLFKYHTRENEFSIKELLRPIIFAPETMKLSTLEKKLRKKRTHMAAVVNEYGDFTGIVTLEDIFEELVGEIEDEFDQHKNKIKKISEKKYEINGDCDIEEVNEKLKLNLLEDGNYITLNGYLIDSLGRIPEVGENVVIPKGKLTVTKSDERKVLLVSFELKK